MDNTVLDENIGLDHLSIVDKDTATLHCEGESSALNSLGRTVGDIGAVDDNTRDDVIPQDSRQLFNSQVGSDITDGLERGIVGGEQCQLLKTGQGVDQVCLDDGVGEGAKVIFGEGIGQVGRDCEHVVDDMDGAAGEVEALEETWLVGLSPGTDAELDRGNERWLGPWPRRRSQL